MIKWLKCLFHGHDYGKFVGYICSACNSSVTIACPRICRYCKKCNKQHIFKLEDNESGSLIFGYKITSGYTNSAQAREIAEKYADKFNNSIE